MNLDQLNKIADLGWGWAVIGVVLLLLVWEGAKKWLPALVEQLAKGLTRLLAGTRLARRSSLRSYRRKVELTWSKLPILFADVELDVSTIYVPLQAAGVAGAGDAHRQIRETDHVVVLGPPGAGKSMLLRHSMLTWARGSGRGRVPLLLELHRCNGNTTSLEQLVVDQFERNGFRKAGRFVERALRTGGLSVLFDGLDEVNAVERDRVIGLLKDFTTTHFACQIVVTCRTAVYDQQLRSEISAVFHVQDFDERLIRRFLRQWPGFGAVEQLMSILRDSPRIMQLARNPLLLTMIAYLYDRGGTLPHSRADFYRDAILELLRIKKDNRYPPQAKKAVLRHLALVAQDVPAHEVDRRTLPYTQVIDEISTKLPSLSVPVDQASDVLQEIVERNGLLLAVDGGERYQFAHLSLQEFLAAEALEQDRDGLLMRYRRAPEDWRETVKLWCGLTSSDCTPMIEAVFEADPVLAFECLADAQVVNEQAADRITSYFQERLGERQETVVEAFGAVGADPRVRGRRVYRFLTETARGADSNRREAACKALAATKLLEAAKTLLELGAYPALATMGDLAVPALTGGLRRGSPRLPIVRTLDTIGTPAAALALTELLWDDDDAAYLTAWSLANLISDPAVEAALAEAEVRPAHTLDWVWAPFDDPDRPALRHIAGRIAFLVEASKGETAIQRFTIDPRLALPLCAFPLNRLLQDDPAIAKPIRDRTESVTGKLSGPQGDVELELAVRTKLRRKLAAHHQNLFEALDSKVRLGLLTRLSAENVRLSTQDWVGVRDDVDRFVMFRSWQHIAAWVLIGTFALPVTARAAVVCWRGWSVGPLWFGWTWIAYVVLVGLLSVSFSLSHEFRDLDTRDGPWNPASYAYVFRNLNWTNPADVGVVLLMFVLVAPWGPVTVALALAVAPAGLWGWVLPTAVAVTALAAALLTFGERRERKASNPLRGLLELDASAARSRTSVIAS